MSYGNNFSIFKPCPELLVSFSLRKDGNMRQVIRRESSINFTSTKNREKFLKALGADRSLLVSSVQEHGNVVKIVRKKQAEKTILKADGLTTNCQGLILSITAADCLPVFLYDRKNKAICLLHAGRRGLERGIITSAVRKMERVYKTRPANILACIGPSICPRHYEIKEDVAIKLIRSRRSIIREKNKIFFNLAGEAALQLTDTSLKQYNIQTSRECTYELPEKYFSFRRDKPVRPKAMLAIFGII